MTLKLTNIFIQQSATIDQETDTAFTATRQNKFEQLKQKLEPQINSTNINRFL